MADKKRADGGVRKESSNIAEKIRIYTANLARWQTGLNELAEHAGVPRHSTGGGRQVLAEDTSTVEAAVLTRFALDNMTRRLDDLAGEVAAVHDGEENTRGIPSPATYLHGLAAWIARQAFARDILAEVESLHNTAAHLLGYMPDYADFHCPTCRLSYGPDTPTPRLRRHPTDEGLPDLYTCPVCGYAAVITPAGPWNGETPINTLRTTWSLRITDALKASDEWVTAAEAARRCGTSASTVRTWKQRGRLTVNEDGKVRLGDVATLTQTSHT